MKTKVILVNPEIDHRTQHKALTDIIRISFPLSLGHLAGYLEREKDCDIHIIDEQLTPLDDEDIKQLVIDDVLIIVGFTTLTATSGRVYELAERFKKIKSKVVTVIGGVHATVLPDEGLQSGSVDFVIRGEGEIPLSGLVACLESGEGIHEIAGLSFILNGHIIHNEIGAMVKDLNELPPFPYHLFADSKDKYSGFFSIQTSRGCPYACVFCSQRSLTGRSYRFVNTERAIHDIELLVDTYHATNIRILDDNIGANKKRLMNLLESIVEKGLHQKVSFEAPMRGDNLDEEILDALKMANFNLITFGLETCVDRLMKLINKGETVQDVTKAIHMTAAKKITTGTTLIFGIPTETRKDRIKTIMEVSKLPLDSVRFNILTPYPGTPVYSQIIERGEELRIHKNWLNFSVQYMWQGYDIPYVPPGTNRYELIFTTMFANLLFYLRPSGLIKIFSQRVAGGNVVLMPKGWLMSRYAFKMLRVGFFLTRKFFAVFIGMIGSHLSKMVFERRQK